MTVLGFLVRRAAWTAVLMLAICFVTFVFFFVLPKNTGNFVYRTEITAGDMPVATGVHGTPVEDFGRFLKAVFVDGSLGQSVITRRPVTQVIANAAPVTASVVLGGMIVWLLLAVPIGVVAALRPRSLLDRGGTIFALLGLSAHPVSIGLLLAWLLGAHWHVFPVVGYCDVLRPATQCGGPTQWAYHLVLPWVTYAMLFAALYARMIRATLLEELGADYVTTARAKGASEWRVVSRHVVRNALLPLTAMVGIDLVPRMLLSIVFVEQVFSLPGLGAAIWQAVDRNDLPVTMGVTLTLALATCVVNFFADVAAAAVDPRMERPKRLGRRWRREQVETPAPAPAALPQRAS